MQEERMMDAMLGSRKGDKVKLTIQVLASSIVAGATWSLAWMLVYFLKNRMDRLTAMEHTVHVERMSLKSIELVLSEMATGQSVMLAFAVVFLLFPAFWGWWVVRLRNEDFPRTWRASLLLAALLVPIAIAAIATCLIFRDSAWSALVCRLDKGHPEGVAIDLSSFAILLMVSPMLWERIIGKKRTS